MARGSHRAARGRSSRAAPPYPGDVVARQPAPPDAGEGPFALWHFSEDPSLSRFRPRPPEHEPAARPVVWAVDTRHAPSFWFPRDCPRVDVIERLTFDDLLGLHARARIELRLAPSIWPFWRRVTNSTVEFSGSRLRNAAPHPEQFG